MKRLIGWCYLVGGILILLGGLLFYHLGVHRLIPVPRPEAFPWFAGIVGILLMIAGACDLFVKKSKKMEIEEKDERNVALSNSAKAAGFEVTTMLLSITLFALALLGYVEAAAFFVLFAVYLFGQLVFVLRLWYLQRKF